MFDGLKRLWRRVMDMFSYTTLKNVIGRDVALSQYMIDAINEWKSMLNGSAEVTQSGIWDIPIMC